MFNTYLKSLLNSVLSPTSGTKPCNSHHVHRFIQGLTEFEGFDEFGDATAVLGYRSYRFAIGIVQHIGLLVLSLNLWCRNQSVNRMITRQDGAWHSHLLIRIVYLSREEYFFL